MSSQGRSYLLGGLRGKIRRLPQGIRWRLKKLSWRIVREPVGFAHAIQGRKVLHLFHISKTGGTAIGEALRGHERSGDYEIIHHFHDFWLPDVPSADYFAVVLRDPISRFVSGFHGRHRQDYPRYPGSRWTPEEAIAFARFHSPNELAMALSSDDPALREAAAESMRSIQHINSPQRSWLVNERYFRSRASKCVFIGFQETLDNDFSLFKRILNLPPDIELPRDEVLSHRNPAHLDRRLDEEAIRNLKIWYREDYALLEVCKEIAAEIRSRYDSSNDVPTDLVPGADVIRR